MIGISLSARFEIGPILYRSTRLKPCVTSRKVAGSIPSALKGPWVDSSSHRNEYQGYLMTGKGRRCVRLTALLPSCADFLEIPVASNSWSANGLPTPYRDSFTVLSILYKMEVFIITMCLNFTYRFPFQKENEVYQTKFIPIHMWKRWEAPTQMSPTEKDILQHWTASRPFTWNGITSVPWIFPVWNTIEWTMCTNIVVLSEMYYDQNWISQTVLGVRSWSHINRTN